MQQYASLAHTHDLHEHAPPHPAAPGTQPALPAAGQSLGQEPLVSPLSHTPLPHLLVAVHTPALLQVVPVPQVPHVPPQPSDPQVLPVHCFVQTVQYVALSAQQSLFVTHASSHQHKPDEDFAPHDPLHDAVVIFGQSDAQVR